MRSRSGIADGLFWYRAGRTWQDRARIGMYWISPYLLGYKAMQPKPVRTSFLNQRDVYLRPASNDVRVLRNVFDRKDNRLPGTQTGDMKTIVDLGAYSGLTTLDFASRYPDAEILAVEPDAENFACLSRNISASAEKHRITTMNVCISDHPGYEQISTTGPHWGRSITKDTGEKVRAMTVAEVLDMLGGRKIDLLKMDIEGAEHLALKSADEWLSRVRWFLLEIHGEHLSLEEVRKILARSGRTTILRRSRTAGDWVDLDEDSIRKFENETKRIDLLVPPPGWVSSDTRAATNS